MNNLNGGTTFGTHCMKVLIVTSLQQLQTAISRPVNACDMIKGNESDVADIAFKILATKTVPILVFNVLRVVNFLTTLYPNIQF